MTNCDNVAAGVMILVDVNDDNNTTAADDNIVTMCVNQNTTASSCTTDVCINQNDTVLHINKNTTAVDNNAAALCINQNVTAAHENFNAASNTKVPDNDDTAAGDGSFEFPIQESSKVHSLTMGDLFKNVPASKKN
eukprot:3886728-Ditylum_brightwellii.AAC.1